MRVYCTLLYCKIHYLIVDFKVRHSDNILMSRILQQAGKEHFSLLSRHTYEYLVHEIEQVRNRERYDARILSISHHRVCFSTGGLPIGKDGPLDIHV